MLPIFRNVGIKRTQLTKLSSFPSLTRQSLSERLIHTVTNIELLEYNRRANIPGVKGLYSDEGLKSAWTDYQSMLIHNVNSFIQESKELDSFSLESLIELTAKNPDQVLINNYATQADNNLFYFNALKNSVLSDEEAVKVVTKPGPEALLANPSLDLEFPNEPPEISLKKDSTPLKNLIVESFGSVAEFRTLLINSGLSIFGNGWVWVVAVGPLAANHTHRNLIFDGLAIINTYNAGYPNDAIRGGQLSEFKQQGKFDDSNETGLSSIEEGKHFPKSPLIPVLAINVGENAYVPDYGFFGKERYLENVWNCIDWSVVDKRLPKFTVGTSL